MEAVLTVIAPPGSAVLDRGVLEAARAAIRGLGAVVGSPRWLKPGEAADLPFEDIAPEAAEAAARGALGDLPLDLVAQAAAGRRKRLLVADMDSTMVIGETLDELAALAGLKERIAAITARAMAGELDFAQALRERVAMLAGLSDTALAETHARLALMPGAATVVATMRKHGAYAALVSGGFRYFTTRVAATLGFDTEEGNTLEVADGALTGRVVEPILDRDAKLATLRRLAAARGLPLSATLSVGDGANDIPMLKAAGLGVAFRAKPAVAAAARVRIDHGDLTALLWAQGYAEAEIVTA
jgi:phosphoserine phosphatase